MSRENFLLKCKALDGSDEFLMISNITRFKDVPEDTKNKKPKHTAVYLAGQVEPVLVIEAVAELERRATAYGVIKVVGNV